MSFGPTGNYTLAVAATAAYAGQILASASWNTINAQYGTALTSLGTVILATKASNLVFSGPTSGSAATATFRALVTADIPVPAQTGIGSYAIIKNTDTGTVVPGSAMVAGTYLAWAGSGAAITLINGPSVSGTWNNYSGVTLIPTYAGLCRRSA